MITAGLFTAAILQQYSGESKVGPRNHLIVQEHNDNELKYEFGPCLYLAYTFGFVELLVGIMHFFLHPYASQSSTEEFDDQDYYYSKENLRAQENMSVYY